MIPELDDEERREVRSKARTAVLDALGLVGIEARRGEVLDMATALARFSHRELDSPPPASASRSYDTMVDHALSWALTNLKREGLVENPRRGFWRLTSRASEPIERGHERPVVDRRLAELRAMPYGEYLRTPEWRRTRAAVLLRAGNHCALDVTHTEHLDVHHNTYERLGAEQARDLIVLCHSCHRLHHRVNGRPRRDRVLAVLEEPATIGASVPPPGWSATAAFSASVAELEARRPSVLRRLLRPER